MPPSGLVSKHRLVLGQENHPVKYFELVQPYREGSVGFHLAMKLAPQIPGVHRLRLVQMVRVRSCRLDARMSLGDHKVYH